jgi:Tfp pilus assembly protein PilF
MKKILVLTVLILGFIVVKSQPVNVQSAANYLDRNKLDKAKESIDLALQDSKTSEWARTWFYKAKIYLNIYLSKDPKIKNLDTNALQVAYESGLKALQMNKVQNQLIKDNQKNQPAELDNILIVCGEQFYNKGVENYNKKLFSKSLEYFDKSISINKMENKIDTLGLFYQAKSAELGGQPEIAKKNYLKLYEIGFKNVQLYIALQKMYKKEKDTAKALEIIKKGLQVYPEILKSETAPYEKTHKPDKVKEITAQLEQQNLILIIEETNIYLAKGETEKAQENLMKAVDKDPKNPNLYYAIGSNYDKIYYDTSKTIQERMNAFAQSEIAYKKSIELKPDYFDPNYNIGALYFNESVRILEAADKIQDENKYNAEKAKVEALWNKALPYLEKANLIQPNDLNTLISLKQIYARTKQYDKAKTVNQKIEELKQKK